MLGDFQRKSEITKPTELVKLVKHSPLHNEQVNENCILKVTLNKYYEVQLQCILGILSSNAQNGKIMHKKEEKTLAKCLEHNWR